MTIESMFWTELIQGSRVDGDAEVLSMTLTAKKKDGSLVCYGVDSYGCFYKIENDEIH